ncbi:hypothetical protein INS49_014833 [Diaporthe citri]|uniref:uncharacterized protein n=1 Tax=Diaporthe citri TaxID=83186 RepID=UPI001C7EC1DF|nr:uncharacterized protein INS49_014833 [Diaporthe citri]KAG6356958.1 hypothetical protein INS49_014833 [Diaporthe citri]
MARALTLQGYSPAWKGLPPAPEISQSANSQRSFQFLQVQLDTCSREHGECNQDSPHLPTRVLDLGNSATVPHVKIFEPPSGTPGKSIALSYCWGDGDGLTAIRSNLSKLLRAIDEDDLPATIRDAIGLARYLRVQYLWVDALCIIQDDTQDWAHESAQMSTVYAQAFLAISASSVDSSRLSFLRHNRPNSDDLFRLQEKAASDQHHDTASHDLVNTLAVRRTPSSGFHQNPEKEILDPSMCRAWTLQEYMLSTRVVSFSTDEVQWTCRTLRACECGNPEKLDPPHTHELQRSLEAKSHGEVGADTDEGRLDRMSTCLDFWVRVVEGYSRRNLSYMRDKLPALSGIACEFVQILNKEGLTARGGMPPSRYLAGLWDTRMHRQLCWQLSKYYDKGFVQEYRAPTWSWASVEGEVAMNHSNVNDFIPQAEILESVCALANPDNPFGQVVRKGTYLRVRATVLREDVCMFSQSPRAGMYQSGHGQIVIDCDVEGIPPNTPIWGQHGTGRSLQRRRGPTATARDNMGQSAPGGLSPGSNIGSGSESEPEGRCGPWMDEWEESNSGGDFTVWLLHMADSKRDGEMKPELLVLCRSAGYEEVSERIGYLEAVDGASWAEDVSGQEKSIVTIT